MISPSLVAAAPAVFPVLLPAPKIDGHHQLYNSDRFRHIVERKTSIEIFTKMLNPQGADA